MTSIFSALMLAASVAQPLPPDSIHHLDATFTDARGQDFKLRERRGKAQLVTMFYSSCRYACPLIVESVKALDRQLSEAEKQKLELLLVSFDPARDTVPVLKALSKERKIDLPRWTLARGESGTVRKLAALLEVRYRQLEDGEFSHTNVIALVDPEGRVLARTEVMGQKPDPEFLKKLHEALK